MTLRASLARLYLLLSGTSWISKMSACRVVSTPQVFKVGHSPVSPPESLLLERPLWSH